MEKFIAVWRLGKWGRNLVDRWVIRFLVGKWEIFSRARFRDLEG